MVVSSLPKSSDATEEHRDNGSHDDGGGGAESTQEAIASDVEKAIRETVAAHPEHRLKQREEESREAQLRRRPQKRAARRIAAK